MKWTLNLGKLLGVQIKVHWTFFLLLGWVVYIDYSQGNDINTMMMNIVYVLSIFFCVVLHEMGHIQMARKYGINTKKITLLPIGGVASLEKIPENPRQELWVALAGPFVNIIIAAIIFPFLSDLASYIPEDISSENTSFMIGDHFWFSLFSVNLLLVVFNMIPAFPMDGGRVFRALLAMKMGRLQATNVASTVGQFAAVFFLIIGLFYNPILILIAVFIFFGAKGEHHMVQQTELLRGHKVSEAMITHFEMVDIRKKISGMTDLLISNSDDIFLVMSNKEFKGIVRRKDLLSAIKEDKTDLTLKDLLRTDFDTVKPTDNLSKILPMIRKHGQSTFPVLDGKEPKGIISLDSIQRYMAVQGALGY